MSDISKIIIEEIVKLISDKTSQISVSVNRKKPQKPAEQQKTIEQPPPPKVKPQMMLESKKNSNSHQLIMENWRQYRRTLTLKEQAEREVECIPCPTGTICPDSGSCPSGSCPSGSCVDIPAMVREGRHKIGSSSKYLLTSGPK